MSELERLEELRKILQADYIIAKIDYEDAVLHGNDVAKNYFYGVMQTLEHVFNYVRILENHRCTEERRDIQEEMFAWDETNRNDTK